jgi:hypothetical protein
MDTAYRVRQKFPYNYSTHEKIGLYMEVATHSGWQGEAGPVGAWLFTALLLDTMTTQGNERSHRCTKHKTSTGIATKAARCGSLFGKIFGLLAVI